jgi:hypothetical protein
VKQSAERRTAGVSEAKGQNMSDAQLNDVGHENALTRGDILAATAIAQFYNFAGRCMDWAKTTRSLQERAVYVQMGLQWLAAGARLQTFLQFKSSQDVSRKAVTQKNDLNVAALDIDLAADRRPIPPDHARLSHDRASQIGDLRATDD